MCVYVFILSVVIGPPMLGFLFAALARNGSETASRSLIPLTSATQTWRAGKSTNPAPI